MPRRGLLRIRATRRGCGETRGGLHRGAWISFPPRDVSRRPARTGFYDTPGVLEAPEVKWTFQADGAIISSAIVFEDKVLFGSDDSNFYALNVENGQPEWIVETGGQVRSSPMVADGVVYFGGDDKLLRAVNAETGEEVWSFEAVVSIRSSPVAAGGSIYVGSDSNVFYSFDARTGLLNWEKIVHDDEDRFIRSSPAVAGDTVYVVTATSRPPFFKSTLHALDRRSGDVIWEYDLEGWSATSVAVSGDAVFVTTTSFIRGKPLAIDGRLYSFDRNTGELRWVFDDMSGAGTRTSPALTDEVAAFAGFNGRYYALDRATGCVSSAHLGQLMGN